MKGYDYDGVTSKGILPGINDVIITGRSCSTNDVLRTQRDMIKHGVPSGIAVYHMPTAWKGLPGKIGLVRTGQWKAMMIDALELEEFFEDEPTQYQSILDHLKGTTKITKV
ncbi:hypothetical protein LCGC14_0805060 [marine sediment metagenome]|uniref:Uncharacterized protein n=1 Tax=marine sediment metagenome TaxID=412755 RepID=A0A0F9PNI8_9ZZZZ